MKDSSIIKSELAVTATLHLEMKNQVNAIQDIVNIIRSCYKKGNKLLLFGNGGSAADAQHVAAEFMGKFQKKRKPLEAISLTTDTSFITAVGNDFGFEHVFSRQCKAMVKRGDIILAFSTSGNSQNVINGAKMAKKQGGIVIGFTGKKGGKLKNYCDYILRVPSTTTPKIQEIHRTVTHIICLLVEK